MSGYGLGLSAENSSTPLELQLKSVGRGEGSQMVGSLCRYPELLRELGADPEAVFGLAGVPVSAVANPQASIAFLTFGRLLAAGAEVTGRDDIGLQIGSRASISLLGPVGELMLTAPTIRDAITDLLRNHQRYIRGSSVYTLADGPNMLLGYAVHQIGTPGILQLWDAVVAAAVGYVIELAGHRPDMEAMLPRRHPDDPRAWHRFLGPVVHFDSEHAGIYLTNSVLRLPNVQADPERRARLSEQIRTFHLVNGELYTDVVAREIRLRLMTDQPTTRSALAEALQTSERSLNRRLGKEGTGFQQVLSATRCEMARQLLAGTNISIGQIALASGFAEHSAFSRAFRTWNGCSAAEWRQALR